MIQQGTPQCEVEGESFKRFFPFGTSRPLIPLDMALESPKRAAVFLGGSCGSSDWRTRIAEPLLANFGISCFNPQRGLGEWNESMISTENDAKKEANATLFVFDRGPSLTLASLVEAAELVCCCRTKPVFLVCESFESFNPLLPPEVAAGVERARCYLKDLARRKEAENDMRILFGTIEEACEAIAATYNKHDAAKGAQESKSGAGR